MIRTKAFEPGFRVVTHSNAERGTKDEFFNTMGSMVPIAEVTCHVYQQCPHDHRPSLGYSLPKLDRAGLGLTGHLPG